MKILIKLKTLYLEKFLLFILIPSYKIFGNILLILREKFYFKKNQKAAMFKDIRTENNDKFIIKKNSKFSEISSVINKNLDENFFKQNEIENS